MDTLNIRLVKKGHTCFGRLSWENELGIRRICSLTGVLVALIICLPMFGVFLITLDQTFCTRYPRRPASSSFLFGATSIVTAFLLEEGSGLWRYLFPFISPSFPSLLHLGAGSVWFGSVDCVAFVYCEEGIGGRVSFVFLSHRSRQAGSLHVSLSGDVCSLPLLINCSVYCPCAKVPRRERSRSALPRSFRDFLLRLSVFFVSSFIFGSCHMIRNALPRHGFTSTSLGNAAFSLYPSDTICAICDMIVSVRDSGTLLCFLLLTLEVSCQRIGSVGEFSDIGTRLAFVNTMPDLTYAMPSG